MKKSVLALLLCTLLVLGMLSMAGNAAMAADKTGTLKAKILETVYSKIPPSDIDLTKLVIYKIGVADPENTPYGWSIDKDFSDYKILETTKTSALGDIAKKVYQAVQKNKNYTPIQTRPVGSTNSAVFESLEPGVYIVGLPSGLTAKLGKGTLSVTPYFLTIPSVVEGKDDNDKTIKLVTYEPSIEMKADYKPTPTPTPVRTTPPPGGGQTPTPTPDETPTPTPSEPVETPTPTPTPVPTTSVRVLKIWDDENNLHGIRPVSIQVQLYANGNPVTSTTLSSANRWRYTFNDLPTVDGSGNRINYTVEETPVNGYTTSVSGTTITNRLIPREPSGYIDLSGNKTWLDNDNEAGLRPNFVTVNLYRNGQPAGQRTVTAANNWAYTFEHLPTDDGYGNNYTYTVHEVGVPGYFSRVQGTNLVNTLIPPTETITDYATPLAGIAELPEQEMEELLDLFDYGTPLFGTLLKTGDETPIYPFIFAGIGGLAVVLLLVFGRKRKSEEVK